jgi:hypothetical protein
MRFDLQRVHFIPKELKPGVLYVSEEFGTAAHLCACGCGSKIRTPLGPTEWTVKETSAGLTLDPSVGNWQRPCKSHYLIVKGKVIWANRWTETQIAVGRRHEETRRRTHFDSGNRAQEGKLCRRFWDWVKGLFG